MIDPNNVLIRCPNGHELQAAKTDLHKALNCPVCQVTFTPSDQPGPVDPTDTQVGTMSYATDAMIKPITYPPYTNWMLGIWIGVVVVQMLGSFYQLIASSEGDSIGSPTKSIMTLSMGCFVLLAIGVVLVMQLMWIFRIHKDAKTARQYQDVSPGLALGLSFIPAFNYPWTAWTLNKLARFVAQEDSPKAAAAIQATKVCFWVGIALGGYFCLNSLMGGWFAIDAFKQMQAAGPQNVDQAALQEEMTKKIPIAWQIAGPLIQVVGVFFYYRAVRTLEAALYPFLGAPER